MGQGDWSLRSSHIWPVSLSSTSQPSVAIRKTASTVAQEVSVSEESSQNSGPYGIRPFVIWCVKMLLFSPVKSSYLHWPAARYTQVLTQGRLHHVRMSQHFLGPLLKKGTSEVVEIRTQQPIKHTTPFSAPNPLLLFCWNCVLLVPSHVVCHSQRPDFVRTPALFWAHTQIGPLQDNEQKYADFVKKCTGL